MAKYIIYWRNKMLNYVIFITNKLTFTKKDTLNCIF